MTTTRQVADALRVVAAIGEAIQELGTIPEGHLYVHLMGNISLENFDAAIRALVKADLVRNDNHMLTWTGPARRAN